MISLSKYEPKTYVEIFEPRYHDRRVLVSRKKVKDSNNKWILINFTKTKSPEFAGDWVISKRKSLTYPVESNGVIDVLAIPFDHLDQLEEDTKDLREVM